MWPPGKPAGFVPQVWIERNVIMNPKEVYLSKPWLKYYSEGVPAEIDIPDISVPELFDQMAEKYGNKPALIFYGKKINYRELKELVDRLADGPGRSGGEKRGYRRPVSLEQPPVCDCLFRHPPVGGQGHAHQSRLYQHRSQTPDRGQRGQDRCLPGHPL